MAAYQSIEAVSSTQLGWLAVSPLHYRWMRSQPHVASDAMTLGSALHTATLEPHLFGASYEVEPDPEQVAPGMAKPRATKAYKDAVAAIEATGKVVVKQDAMAAIDKMSAAVRTHARAAKLLDRTPWHEITMLWNRDGRMCRGRADLLGDGVLADLKTTRSLAEFSPWTVTNRRYYAQAAHYIDGAEALGEKVEHFFFIVVESSPPYDVGVFVLDPAAIEFGRVQNERLFRLLDECERTDTWPGMFPEIETAMLSPNAVDRNAELDMEVA